MFLNADVRNEMNSASDIASFSILKDATATALYGVRGANGIVLITTKRGSESRPKVSVKLESGLTSPTQLPQMASAAQFIDYLNTMTPGTIDDYSRSMYLASADVRSQRVSDAEGALPILYSDLYPNVDWIHELFRDRGVSVDFNITAPSYGVVAGEI